MVLHQTTRGFYILAELDGVVSKLQYAAFCLLPYYPQFQTNIPVTELTGLDNKDLDEQTLKSPTMKTWTSLAT